VLIYNATLFILTFECLFYFMFSLIHFAFILLSFRFWWWMLFEIKQILFHSPNFPLLLFLFLPFFENNFFINFLCIAYCSFHTFNYFFIGDNILNTCFASIIPIDLLKKNFAEISKNLSEYKSRNIENNFIRLSK